MSINLLRLFAELKYIYPKPGNRAWRSSCERYSCVCESGLTGFPWGNDGICKASFVIKQSLCKKGACNTMRDVSSRIPPQVSVNNDDCVINYTLAGYALSDREDFGHTWEGWTRLRREAVMWGCRYCCPTL